jgi:hypothetical protein
MMMKILVLTIPLIFLGCINKPDEPLPNIRPETYIALFPDSSLNRTSSRLHLYWWGYDEDGWVIGYVFTFDRRNWFWTNRSDSVFGLAIFGQDTSYTFFILAVDNTGDKLPEGARVNFVDTNGNGIWDEGEEFELPDGSYDDTPASMEFPIKNTPPSVEFAMTGEFAGTRLDVPDTTFPIVSFQWIATDIDGDNTITEFWVALNDTSDWVVVPGQFRFITLVADNFSPDDTVADAFVFPNLTQTLGRSSLPEPLKMKLDAENVLYLKARDIAGAFSQTVRMPVEGKTWYVKKPRGDLLVVVDYGVADRSVAFYRSILDSIGGGILRGRYDIWDLRVGGKYPKRGALVPPFPRADFTETLLRFYKYIFWISSDETNYDIAEISLPRFKSEGGKVLFSFILPRQTAPEIDVGKAISDFSGVVDSISSAPVTGFVASGVKILNYNPDDSSQVSDYPVLTRDSFRDNPFDGGKIIAYLRELYPSANAHPIYWMEPRKDWGNRSFIIGVEGNDGNFILVGFPIYRFNGGDGRAGEFIEKVFKKFGAIP